MFRFFLLPLSLLLIPVAIAWAAKPPDLMVCEALLAAAADGEKPAQCLYDVAVQARPSSAHARRKLEMLHVAHPRDPWYPLQIAHLTRRDRGAAEAEALYRRTIDLARNGGAARAEFSARAGLIRVFQAAGRPEAARSELEQAVQIAMTSGDTLLRLKGEILRANDWTQQGEIESAYAVLHRIRKDVEGEKSLHLEREYLFALGRSALETGRFREAAETYRRLVDVTTALGDIAAEVSARSGLARVRRDELIETPTAAGREELLGLARRNLSLARTAGNPTTEVHSLWLLGSLESGAEAIAHLERCSELASGPLYKSFCRSELAKHLARVDPGAARDAIHDALTLAHDSGDILAKTSSWYERMRVSWSLDPPDAAWQDARMALDAIEALRDQQGGSVSQPGLFSTWAEGYYWLSGTQLERRLPERAFGIIERMRSRTLIDALGLSRPGPGASPALYARRADIFLDIARVQRHLFDPSSEPGDRAKARAELDRLELEASALQTRIARLDTAFGIRRPDFPSLEQVRQALAPGEALLSFQIAPWKDLAGDFGGGSWLLVSTRDATRVYRLPDRTELRPAVTAFTGMFAARDGIDARGAPVLYGKLLATALAELPSQVRRLVIVPDDFLHRLPFAALRPDPEADPLIARYEITLAPSATLWLHWRETRPAPAVTPALVLADPVTLVTRGDAAAAERSATFLSPLRLGRLPHALTEGKAVMRHLGRGELLVGKQASETYIKRNGAGPFDPIHFAAHAVTDEINPERSAIYLSPGDDKEDGMLQAREIAALDLDGRIVVLSTCESASGEILRGEGVMGLARAFFQAGAHTVVASLWPLRDDDGAALFDRFYLHLGDGKSVAAALQAAQRDRMDDGAPAEAWAGVVVLGDGDRIPVPGGRGPGLWPLVLGLIAALAATLLILRRRSAVK